MLRRILPLFLLAALAAPCAAQDRAAGREPERLAWFREARFGLFVHWGPVSLEGTEIGWSRGGERRGRKGRGTIPVEVYDNLYKRFDPTAFDARRWVAIAKRAGMKYLVFTTKHHDGFCMFDTGQSEYKITRAPIGRDLVKELADACHEAGLRLGFYYSQPDWHHPDYRTERHARYIEYLHAQVRELLTNYGRVDILWFDGLGGSGSDWDAPRLFEMIRALQPGILINNRAGLPGDFRTPEQRVGAFQAEQAWESCITICRQWAWKPKDELKSLQECVRTLVSCAGGDGNLLLNVGPMPTGEIEPRQVQRLEEVGDWLARFGEAIYGTRGGPLKPGSWGASTHRGKTLYLHLYECPGGEIELPGLGVPVRAARLLASGAGVACVQDGERLRVMLPQDQIDPIDTIVELTLEGDAAAIPPRAVSTSNSLCFGCKASASNVFHKSPSYAPELALDDDPRTRWATDAGTREAWIEIDLGKARTFDRVRICEAEPYADRVEAFRFLAFSEGEWSTVFEDKGMGASFERRVPARSASRVRLEILSASEGPTISEIQLLAPGDDEEDR